MTDRVVGHLTYYFDTEEEYNTVKAEMVASSAFSNYVFNDETRVIEVDIDTANA